MIKIDLKPTVPELKSFGFIALFGFSLMATMVMWNFTDWQLHWSVYLLFGLAAICPLLSLIAPAANRPIYVTLMVLAFPIGFVVSNIVLRLIYYGLFTPIALWFRLRGRDSMDRQFDPAAGVYSRNDLAVSVVRMIVD